MKIIILLILSGQVFAWGSIGHYIIGELASKHLNSKAKKKIHHILKGVPLSRVGVWADFIKSDSKYQYLNQWHYINVPQGKDYLDVIPQKKGDLISGIIHCIGILESTKSSDVHYEVALKMLIHLIGDLHQPFHNGYRRDRGGNKVILKWFGKKTNLHMVWDDHMIELQKMSFSEYAKQLNNFDKKELQSISKGTIYDWHLESRKILANLYKRGEDRHWEYNYTYKHLATVEQRLKYAAIRLANVLNKVFEKTPHKTFNTKLKGTVPSLKFL